MKSSSLGDTSKNFGGEISNLTLFIKEGFASFPDLSLPENFI